MRTGEITVDYFHDGTSSTIATPHPDDFQSVAFTNDRSRTGLEYRRFANSHRLFTINRHIGHTSSSKLIGHLIRMGRPIQPVVRMRILARIVRHELRRRAH